MVRIFSMYHFNGQLVDTVDDMSASTVTWNNKLLIAQDDYSVEVKDLLSDKKSPIFVFSTVEKVHKICHCASGNYVTTVEGKQTFEKSDRLIVRIYTNWETDFSSNESKKSSSYAKRLVRARIAGVVTPSNTKTDEDFLDMIEIPISFTSPTLLTVCQDTGKLLITCGPTMHLFNQMYTRNHDKTPYFMDFIPFNEVFQLDFLPLEVIMSDNIIASYSEKFISVFQVAKLSETDETKSFYDCAPSFDAKPIYSQKNNENFTFCKKKTKVPEGPLNVAEIFKMIQENQEDEIVQYIDSRSFPLFVSLKGINDNVISMRAKRLPFKKIVRNDNCDRSREKIPDILVETLCDQNTSYIAKSILALQIKDPDESIRKVALQACLPQRFQNNCSDHVNDELFSERSARFISLNVLVSTFQEGYLFHSSADHMPKNLHCVAVFNFTSQVISLMFEGCFLHVLTLTGLEIYNVPSLHSSVLSEKPNLNTFSQYVSIIGMHPFLGIIDFIGSKDLIIIFTSANEGKVGKESLPWTVYSLKKPRLFEVYQEMIENSNSYKSRDDQTYRYLSLESFLILQAGINLNITSCNDVDESFIRSTHEINSIELAKIFFRSKSDIDVAIGSSIVLAAGIDPIKFIQSLEIEKYNILKGKIYLLKQWIEKGDIFFEDKAEWLINIFAESDEILSLSSLILSNRRVCRTFGHKAIPCFKKYFALKRENCDMQIVYILVILLSQECFQNEVIEILFFIKGSNDERRRTFCLIVLQFWEFLIDEVIGNSKRKLVFSDLSSLFCEHLSVEMAEILSALVLQKNVFEISDIVQMLMMEFPCRVSVQKGTFVLRSFLEKVLSSRMIINYDDPNMSNCVKILARSYLSDLFNQHVNECKNFENIYQPIFVDQLPSFVNFLPQVIDVNPMVLKRIQELVWSKKLNEESTKEILSSLTNVNLKLNVTAMLNQSDFAKNLIECDCLDALLPFAKSSFDSAKKWRDFINYLQDEITELEESKKNATSYERILKEFLNHLASNLTPPQLNALLESIVLKDDELYWKSIIRAQQISFADNVKELISNTSQQLLMGNSTS